MNNYEITTVKKLEIHKYSNYIIGYELLFFYMFKSLWIHYIVFKLRKYRLQLCLKICSCPLQLPLHVRLGNMFALTSGILTNVTLTKSELCLFSSVPATLGRGRSLPFILDIRVHSHGVDLKPCHSEAPRPAYSQHKTGHPS